MKTAVNIRMPKAMKDALSKLAAAEFRSLSSLIIKILDDHLRSAGIDWNKEATKQEQVIKK